LAQWIYAHSRNPHPGYFVEFGATDGVSISNTYLLELDGWQGVLAEPARNWHKALIKNRGVIIDTSCVYSTSNQKVEFFESEESEYSTVLRYRDADAHAGERTKGSTYLVDTISLEDLLKKHNAPKCITYLSIDTEGSEWEILKEFNFNSFEAIFLSIEHNYNQNRENIQNLLLSNGYIRIFEKISAFEDWFINPRFFDARKLFNNA
jgi:FkbM family methyltransferase